MHNVLLVKEPRFLTGTLTHATQKHNCFFGNRLSYPLSGQMQEVFTSRVTPESQINEFPSPGETGANSFKKIFTMLHEAVTKRKLCTWNSFHENELPKYSKISISTETKAPSFTS